MPASGQFFPRASSRHRFACKALYHALLKPCNIIPLPSEFSLKGRINPIKHLIRKRFRQNAKSDSPNLIRKCLKIGYLAEHLLRLAALGVKPAIEQVHSFLRTTVLEAEVARKNCAHPKCNIQKRQRVWPLPGVPRVVDIRPLPLEKISSGRRHVPSLVLTSGGFPFLRFKKSQSPYLSRVIRDKVNQKQKMLDQSNFLEETEELGKTEDTWENIVLSEIDRSVKGGINEGGVDQWWTEYWGKGLGEDERSWVAATSEIRKKYDINIKADRAHAKLFGEKLIRIRDEEKKLWQLERTQRKLEKHREKLKKRLETSDKSKPDSHSL
ncbi:putative dna repair protein [Erysiphe neolycopersici]|uniref:Putative dna repair protein n=1 Tax=Erysiphe neolycopersici TaxID=212602 RepID=A0A420HG38_9PEZI|nr:putative dna repair protein [Erysiphe neolycopersici]